MGLLATVLDTFADESSKGDTLIKSGSLRTTRATALLAASVVATMAMFNELAPEVLGLDAVTPAQKFAGALAVGFIWSIGSSADALARGIAAAGGGRRAAVEAASYAVALAEITTEQTASHGLRVLQPPLTARLVDKEDKDEPGWLAVAAAVRPTGLEVCFVKGDTVEWRSAGDRHVRWTVSA